MDPSFLNGNNVISGVVQFGFGAAFQALGGVTNFTNQVAVNANATFSAASSAVLNILGQILSSTVVKLQDSSSLTIGNGSVSATFIGSISGSGSTTITVSQNGLLVINGNSVVNGTLSLLANSAFFINNGVTSVAKGVEAWGNTTVTSALVFTSSAVAYTQHQGFLVISNGGQIVSGVVNVTASATLQTAVGISNVATIIGNVYSYGKTAVANVLNATGNFFFATTSNLVVAISGSTSSQIILGGSVSQSGSISIAGNSSAVAGTNYTIISFVGAGSGNFTSVPPSYKVTYGTAQTQLDYASSPTSSSSSSSSTTSSPVATTGSAPSVSVSYLFVVAVAFLVSILI